MPFPTNLGSRDWTSDERDPWPELGEWEGAYQWSNGLAPRPLPLPTIVGNPECFELGEAPGEAPALYPNSPCRAYPVGCYGKYRIGTLDIGCCGTALALANVLYSTYQDVDSAKAVFEQLLGAGWVFRLDGQVVQNVPNTLIAYHPSDVCFVFVTGTTTPQQYALQGLYSVISLIDYGSYSTYPFWQATADIVQDRIVDRTGGVFDEIYLIGHSLGGAVCQILGARLGATRPDVNVNILTFGMPVAGDDRINDLVENFTYVNYKNNDDPVPGVPPYGADLVSMYSFITGSERHKFQTLVAARHRFVLAPDGKITELDGSTLPFGTLKAIMELIIAAADLPVFEEHLLGTYLRRLALACPEPQPTFEMPVQLRFTLDNVTLKFQALTLALDCDIVCSFDGFQWSGAFVAPANPGPYGWTVFLEPIPPAGSAPYDPPFGLEVTLRFGFQGFPAGFGVVCRWEIFPYTYYTQDSPFVLLPPMVTCEWNAGPPPNVDDMLVDAVSMGRARIVPVL